MQDIALDANGQWIRYVLNVKNIVFHSNNFPKKTGKNLKWSKMAIPNFFQQFFPRRLVQIWNGQKWPFQIFSNNFSQKDWYRLRMAKNVHSKLIQTFLVQNDWKKFGMAKTGHSELI